MKMITLPLGALETNCYVVYDEASKACALVDPGAMPQTILDTLEKNELALQKIFLTHAHFDHILAVHDVLEATGAQFVCPEADTWLLSRDNMGQFRSLARSYVQDTPDILAGEGTAVTFGGLTATYMSTPGHTPGSSVIKIGDCLFTGDTLFRHECGRCDLEGGDFSAMLRSLKRLSELEGDYKVLPGHEGISTLDEERAANPYMLQARGR
mgnify:CR=1 FL=1